VAEVGDRVAAERSPAEVEVSGVVAREGAGEIMSLFTADPSIDHARVVAAIARAEALTSGEIRILIAREKAADPLAAAQRHFGRLGMTQTTARNGVLIFLAPRSHAFAIVGDIGIHDKCGDEFWRGVASTMEHLFKRGEFTEGLVKGVEVAGALLAAHFPRPPDDRNELPDHIEEH
jgi:uncharacterized membrane protein